MRIHANLKLNVAVRLLIVERNLDTSFHIRRRKNRTASTDKTRRHLCVQNPFSHRLGRLALPEDLSGSVLFCH